MKKQIQKKASILSFLFLLILLPILLIGIRRQQQTKNYAAGSYLFGTLETDSSQAQTEHNSGIGVAMLSVAWNQYEPQDGVFDSNYASQLKQQIQAFQAAGQKIVLTYDLHYYPSWLLTYPNSTYVNQYGVSSTGSSLNLTFSQTLRTKAQAYIDRINQDLGLSNFWAIRINTAVDAGELLFPQATDSAGHTDSYWAYDPNAQNGSDMPKSLAPNPYPGWKPGQKTYNGQPFSTTQVQQWLDWYIKALDDTANWQIQYIKAKGYSGQFQLLTPGDGTRPDGYQNEITTYLSATGTTNTTARAAVWDRVYAFLPDKTNVVAYVSSMADGSGNPTDNLCSSTDSIVSLTDPAADSWSAARWIARIATQYSLPISGENPGYPSTNYGFGMMQTTAQQMASCNYQGMFWAHDHNLYDGQGGVTLQDYATVIAQYNGTVTTPTPIPQTTFRVYPGSTNYTDTSGNVWSPDGSYASAGSLDSTTTPIAGTNDQQLYQNERWGPFTYNFPLKNGTYTVTLKFAEIYFTSVGQRVFNVSINGTQVLTNFDIVQAAGSANTALDKTFTTSVTKGNLAVTFTTGTADDPKISSLQIVPSGSSTPTPTPSQSKLYGIVGQGSTSVPLDITLLQNEYTAGVRAWLIEPSWSDFQPNASSDWSSSAVSALQQRIDAITNLGSDVKLYLDLGMQYPPAWVANTDPLTDQNGNTWIAQSSNGGGANIYWSPTVRSYASLYIQKLFSTLNFHGRIWVVRVGPYGGELIYPDVNNNNTVNTWWAFDQTARSQVPSSIANWKPGDPSPNGEALTFYNWYVDNLVNTFHFVLGEVRKYYSGYVAPITGGGGMWDTALMNLTSNNLTSPTDIHAGTGNDWKRIYGNITHADSMILDWNSGVGDNYNGNDSSPNWWEWHTEKIHAWFAQQNGRPVYGENPNFYAAYQVGQCGAPQYGNMQWDFQALQQYGYLGIMWVRESNMTNSCNASLANYGALIIQYSLSTPSVTQPVQTPTASPSPTPTTIVNTIDDSVMGTGINQFSYSGSNWGHCSNCGSGGLYDGTTSYDSLTNEYVTIQFYGTQISYYGEKDSYHGIAGVSIDNGTETQIDLYSPTRLEGQLLWTSSSLTPGFHTFKLRVTGLKNAASTGTTVPIDRVDIARTSLPGDANSDGIVNSLDIKTILQNWLQTITGSIDQFGDRRINAFDAVVVLNNL